jgi:hypothetical protein
MIPRFAFLHFALQSSSDSISNIHHASNDHHHQSIVSANPAPYVRLHPSLQVFLPSLRMEWLYLVYRFQDGSATMRRAARLFVLVGVFIVAHRTCAYAVIPRSTGAGFLTPSRRKCQETFLRRSSAVCLVRKCRGIHSRPCRGIHSRPCRSLRLSVHDVPAGSISAPPQPSSIVIASGAFGVHLPPILRATASAAATYVGIVAYLDRPRGTLCVGHDEVRVQQSTVPGAGLGLFASKDLSRGTVLGTYPGVVIPLLQHTRKLRQCPACEGYIWRFSDNQMVIDPTNQVGELEDAVVGGNPSQPGSVFLFESILSKLKADQASPTILCRINEPPRGRDVNVVTREDLGKRTVTFELERDVCKGEELFIDYGLSYDRSRYGGGTIEAAEP